MICLFCDSENHESKDCDIFVTKKSRRRHPNSKRFCFSCSTESVAAHLPGVKECESNENCVGWFSTEHHLLFCRERIKAFKNLFRPKIDQNILQRFLKTVEIDEKYSMILSSPKNQKIVPFSNIKIMQLFNIGQCWIPAEKTVINNKMEIPDYDFEYDMKLLDFINAKTVICLPKILYIIFSSLPADIILQMLSSHTKEFKLIDSYCNPRLSFLDITKKAPNLDIIDLDNKNIVYESSWIQDLLKYKNGKNFAELSFMPGVIELDVEALVEFIQKKCRKNVEIRILFFMLLRNQIDKIHQKYNEVIEKVQKYFDFTLNPSKYDLQLMVELIAPNCKEEKNFSKIKSP